MIRLAGFRGSDEDMESLASLATNKPVAQWVDPDFDRATVELADLAQRFKRLEAYAHVKGRPDKRHAIALVVGNEWRVGAAAGLLRRDRTRQGGCGRPSDEDAGGPGNERRGEPRRYTCRPDRTQRRVLEPCNGERRRIRQHSRGSWLLDNSKD